MFKRIVFLGYYLKEMDKRKFKKFVDFVSVQNNQSKISLLKDIFLSSIIYNISPLDYFYFKFYEKDRQERETYAGTGTMYEYQLKMNPKSSRNILENKLLFLKEYNGFIKHQYYSLKKDHIDRLINSIYASKFKKIVLKSSNGQCGEGVEVLEIDHNRQSLKEKLSQSKNDLLEEFIVQHDKLMELSPSGLNTIRIFTQLNANNVVDILGCRLRITINSNVDNLAAGNIAAPVDELTGKVTGPGVYSDITKSDEFSHPITGVEIKGFQVPFWKESIQMVKSAALLHPQNRSIGWDVAITNSGPELLEGNHNWCKLLWQLPVKKGLKKELEKYTT
ncbi:sugar-transfer associated ATP-grasp domain-containing protein [Namhaeicola litoreus]|uniref:Sugar-transfer associated ATP-grasp domain-containing protein n=1 Tax=Namhaeicola litoreus TaxID=1052145 RepID=A0ABW3Y4Q8_9FLAO